MSYPFNDPYQQKGYPSDSSYDRMTPPDAHVYGVYPVESQGPYIYGPRTKSGYQFYQEPPKYHHESDAESLYSFNGDVSSVLACCSTETLQTIMTASESGMANQSYESLPSHSPERLVPVNLPALIEAQNSGIIRLSLPAGT